MDKDMDSKVSRTFLRKVMKCLGREIPGEISLNSWELYDFIEKDISILLQELERAKGNVRNLMSSDEDRRQFTIQAIGDFYNKGNNRQRKDEYETKQKTNEKTNKVE